LIHIYLLAFGVAFADMGMRSFQQLNVFHARYVSIWITAFCMAHMGVLSIGLVIMAKGFDEWLAIAYGLGWGLGSTCATWFAHRSRH
jgi:hypothetical protein